MATDVTMSKHLGRNEKNLKNKWLYEKAISIFNMFDIIFAVISRNGLDRFCNRYLVMIMFWNRMKIRFIIRLYNSIKD